MHKSASLFNFKMKKKKFNRDKIARHITNVMLEKHFEEEKEFEMWIATNTYAANILKGLSNPKILSKKLSYLKYPNKEEDALLLIKKIEMIQKRRRLVSSAMAAASAILFLSMIVWYGIISKEESITIAEANKTASQEMLMLVLSDGNMIELNKVNDTLIVDGVLRSVDITKIAPQINGNEKGQLIVPSKCTYRLILSDSTKVILNSNSKLIFPQTFTSERREVELIGEGYFEVTKDDKRPFIVKSGDYTVEVHGTKFNMNCRSHSMKTFLLEGSVSVSINNEKKKMLHPMQIASFDGDSLRIENVEEKDIYLSWLSNNFAFNALPLEEVVREIEQWYGVSFDKSFSIMKPLFVSGMFDRGVDLSELIKLIEKIAEVEIVNKNGIYFIKSKDYVEK